MTDDDQQKDVIYQSLVEARSAVGEWQTARKFQAEGSSRHNVQAQRLRAEHGVFSVIEHLRPYLIDKLPDYWSGYDEHSKWLFFDEEQQAGLPGLKAVLMYRGRVNTREETVKSHDGYSTETVTEADMLPAEVVLEALSWCSQAAYKLGFLPDSNGQRDIFNTSTGAGDPDAAPKIDDGDEEEDDVTAETDEQASEGQPADD
jgi:hypothetical protein